MPKPNLINSLIYLSLVSIISVACMAEAPPTAIALTPTMNVPVTPMPTVTPADLLPTPTASATPAMTAAPPAAGIIIYIQESEKEIWHLDVATKRTKQITSAEDRDRRIFNPQWAPDGQVFAYERASKVWLSDREGENQRKIIDASNFWWINATTLRYCRHKEIGASCFLFDIETNTTERLQVGDYWWIFAYSPDVSKVFVQERQATEKIQPQTTQYLLDVKTGQKIFEYEFEYEIGRGYWTEDPKWTPDGQQVAFTSGIPGQSLSGEVFVVDINGEDFTQLTNFSQQEENIYPALLQWSPDGEWLALVLATSPADELAILKSDGSTLKRLGVEWLTLAESNLHPVWSPDSRQIAFLSNQLTDDGQWQIYAVDIETGDVFQLTDTPGRKTWLDWK